MGKFVLVQMFQSTLPRRERPKPRSVLAAISDVSIHAPTKGATDQRCSQISFIRCFNPRSHEGSDQTDRLRLLQFICFNPRSHEGSDDYNAPRSRAYGSFNPRSHEGSDMAVVRAGKKQNKFQSTLPRRERRDTSLHHRPRDTFQSTLPRRERRTAENTISRFDRFNPRSHEGSDISAPSLICIEFVSIHAPTKGATWAAKTRKRSNYCFNPRSHEGSDSCRLQRIYQGGSFNPRSHEGSDLPAVQQPQR